MDLTNRRTLSIISLFYRKDLTSYYTDSETLSHENEEDDEYDVKAFNHIYFANYQSTLTIQTALLEYKEFKAARTIQMAFRVWSDRRRFEQIRHASIVIQRRWRSFYKAKNIFLRTEKYVQEQLMEYYEFYAIKIQAAYRGFWSRKHSADFYYRKQIHVEPLIDLLYCMANDLKIMKNRGLLPGVYSMRNSPCLFKSEDYLSTYGFRFHNQFIETEWRADRARIAQYRRSFQKAAEYTPIPYSGHDPITLCRKTTDLHSTRPPKRVANTILKFIAQFRKGKIELARGTYKQRRQKKYTRAWEAHKARIQKRTIQSENFCEELIEDMNRWRNIDGNLVFSKNVLHKPCCLKQLWKSDEHPDKPISQIRIPSCSSLIDD